MLDDPTVPSIQNAVTAFRAGPVPGPCLLLVHRDIRRLDDAADTVVSTYGWPRLSVGRELSDALLPEPRPRRSYAAREWLRARLEQMAPGPVFCTEI